MILNTQHWKAHLIFVVVVLLPNALLCRILLFGVRTLHVEMFNLTYSVA